MAEPYRIPLWEYEQHEEEGTLDALKQAAKELGYDGVEVIEHEDWA